MSGGFIYFVLLLPFLCLVTVMEAIGDAERTVIEMLKPMFSNLSEDDLKTSVFHPKNRGDQCDQNTLFERCLNDLLETVAVREKSVG